MHELCRDVADSVEAAVEPLIGESRGAEVLRLGADGTPTKRIDESAEEAALEVLENYGDVRVVSEEAGEITYGEPERVVALDPLDGTYNASRRIPFYGVSIAVLDGERVGDAEYAYVRELTSGESFTAERGGGAYVDDVSIEVSGQGDPSEMTVGGVYNIEGFDPAVFKRVRLLGCSSLELCYVAAGRLDGFLDMRSRLRVVDFAAGKLMVEEAGGTVTDGSGEDLENAVAVDQRSSVVAANPEGHRGLLGVVDA